MDEDEFELVVCPDVASIVAVFSVSSSSLTRHFLSSVVFRRPSFLQELIDRAV